MALGSSCTTGAPPWNPGAQPPPTASAGDIPATAMAKIVPAAVPVLRLPRCATLAMSEGGVAVLNEPFKPRRSPSCGEGC